MRSVLWKSFVGLTLFVASAFLWMASWGMVMGEDYPISFSTCERGTGYTGVFSRNFSFDTFARVVGNETIYIEVRGIAVPGFLIAHVRRPFCTDAEPVEVSEYLERYRLGFTRRRPEHEQALAALRQGYERAEAVRRLRGGRVLDDEPPEDTTTIPQEEPSEEPSEEGDEEFHDEENLNEKSLPPLKNEYKGEPEEEPDVVIPGLHDRKA